MLTTRSSVAVLALSTLGIACTGSISPGSGSPGDPNNQQGGNSTENGGSNSGGNSAGNSGSGGVTQMAAACLKQTVPIGAVPIARLTNVQYANTVRALFSGTTIPAVSLPAEIRRKGGFINQGEVQNPTASVVEQLNAGGDAAGRAVAARIPGSLGCANPSDEVACGNSYVDGLLRKAFRRPPSTGERDRYRTLFTTARTEFGYSESIALVTRTVLQSPYFLYRIELGDTSRTQNGKTPLTAHEVATRLSYFLTDSAPDATLASAADSGALLDAQEVASHAERLLASPQARSVVASFQNQWLHLDQIDKMDKRKDLFPEFGAALKTSYKNSVAKFLENQVWNGEGSLKSMLTDSDAFVDSTLAPIYGVPSPGASMSPVALDKTRRAGLLTQAGVLAMLAHPDIDSPTLRGVFVLENFLCEDIPSPPPGAVTVVPDSPVNRPMTTRQRMEEIHVEIAPTCNNCHTFLDGIGFGFSNYDSIGRHRTQENGIDTDDTGTIVSVDEELDIEGPFKGVVELSAKLAQSHDVDRCYASQILAFGRALSLDDLDPCAAFQLLATLPANPSTQELILAVAGSDAFRFLDAQ